MNSPDNSLARNLVEFTNKVVIQRNTYTLLQKQTAIKRIIRNEEIGIKHAIKFTSDEIHVEYNLLQSWSKKRDDYLSSNSKPNNRRLSSGPALKYPDIELHVKFWVLSMRELYLCVSCPMVVCEIFREFPNRFLSYNMCEKWVYNALARMKLSVRAKTHDQGQLTEAEMGEIHIDLLEHFERLQTFLDVRSNLIVNMDETGCYFNMSSKRTLNIKGAKHINVKASKTTSHCTVFLAVALNGAKLKPLVVFKGEPGARVNRSLVNCDQRNAYICQVNAFCDAVVMDYWIEKCLTPFNPEKKSAILMMDNFAAHNVTAVRTKIADNGWAQLCLPPNMTSRVQILDVCINKPFKDRMSRYKSQFMVDNIRNNPKVTRELMGLWIADSWADIPSSFVQNGCESIGFRVEASAI